MSRNPYDFSISRTFVLRYLATLRDQLLNLGVSEAQWDHARAETLKIILAEDDEPEDVLLN